MEASESRSQAREMSTERYLKDGETWLLRSWPSPVESRTLLVIHHGLGEHSGRYETFARHLADLPLHLWSYDLRGHGNSPGKRGHANGLEQLADDFATLLPVFMQRSGTDRVILLGHSMGAAALGWYLTRPGSGEVLPASIRAVALSAPAVAISSSLSVRLKTLAARGLVRIAPALTLPSGIDPTGISSDPAEVARYASDPDIHDRLSVRLGLSLLDDGPAIVSRADQVRLPLLLWHGVDDPIVDISGSRAMFTAWGGADKVLIELPGCRHESHHERPDKTQQLFSRLRAWLAPRLQGDM